MGPNALVLSCKSYLEALDRSDWLTPGPMQPAPEHTNSTWKPGPAGGLFFIAANRNESDRTDLDRVLQNHLFEFILQCMLSHFVIPAGFWGESNGIRLHSGATLAERLLPSVLMGAEQPKVCYKKAGRIRSGISLVRKAKAHKTPETLVKKRCLISWSPSMKDSHLIFAKSAVMAYTEPYELRYGTTARANIGS